MLTCRGARPVKPGTQAQRPAQSVPAGQAPLANTPVQEPSQPANLKGVVPVVVVASADNEVYSEADAEELNRLKQIPAGKLVKLKQQQAAKLVAGDGAAGNETQPQYQYSNLDGKKMEPASNEEENFYGSRNQRSEATEFYGALRVDDIIPESKLAREGQEIHQESSDKESTEAVYVNNDVHDVKEAAHKQETYQAYIPPKEFEDTQPEAPETQPDKKTNPPKKKSFFGRSSSNADKGDTGAAPGAELSPGSKLGRTAQAVRNGFDLASERVSWGGIEGVEKVFRGRNHSHPLLDMYWSVVLHVTQGLAKEDDFKAAMRRLPWISVCVEVQFPMICFYIDGALVHSALLQGSFAATTAHESCVTIGRRSTSRKHQLTGELKNVQLVRIGLDSTALEVCLRVIPSVICYVL